MCLLVCRMGNSPLFWLYRCFFKSSDEFFFERLARLSSFLWKSFCRADKFTCQLTCVFCWYFHVFFIFRITDRVECQGCPRANQTSIVYLLFFLPIFLNEPWADRRPTIDAMVGTRNIMSVIITLMEDTISLLTITKTIVSVIITNDVLVDCPAGEKANAHGHIKQSNECEEITHNTNHPIWTLFLACFHGQDLESRHWMPWTLSTKPIGTP